MLHINEVSGRAAHDALDRVASAATAWGQPAAGATLRRLGEVLSASPTSAEGREAARTVLLWLRPGSGQLSDIYVRHDDGTPNVPASVQFQDDVAWLIAFCKRASK